MDKRDEAPNSLNELEKHLYTKDDSVVNKKSSSVLHKKDFAVSPTWGSDADPVSSKINISKINSLTDSMKPSFFKKIFIYSLIVLLGSLVFAGYKLFGGPATVSNDNIDIVVLGNSFAEGGEELSLQIEITNRNSVPLELADLLVEYPKGGATVSGSDIVRLPRINIGTIDSGRTHGENIKVVLFGEQGSIKDVKVSLEYRIQGSSAIFVKDINFPVTINSAPVTLSIDAPTESASNQDITLVMKVASSAEKSAENMLMRVEYPSGFRFSDSTPAPASLDNVWELGDISPVMEKTVTIKGSLNGQDGEERAFRVYVGEASADNLTSLGVTYTSLSHIILIKKPFLETELFINGSNSEDVIVSGGKDIEFEINWKNNLPTRVTDLEMTAKITGNAYDENSLTLGSGFYDSLNNKIIWDKSTTNGFVAVEPGDSGTVSFDLSSVPLYSGNTLLESPSIIVEISIKGKQPSLGGLVTEVTNFQKRTVKVATDLQVAGKALYFQGPFVNTGPMPPRAEQETTYTITWSVTNSSSDVTGAEAKAVLPTYVKYAGATYPASENIIYDDTTRTVTWKLGNVLSGTGLTKTIREGSFKIALTPSTSQIDTTPQIILETVLTGTDSFTDTIIRSSRSALTTALYNDNNFITGMGKVTP